MLLQISSAKARLRLGCRRGRVYRADVSSVAPGDDQRPQLERGLGVELTQRALQGGSLRGGRAGSTRYRSVCRLGRLGSARLVLGTLAQKRISQTDQVFQRGVESRVGPRGTCTWSVTGWRTRAGSRHFCLGLSHGDIPLGARAQHLTEPLAKLS